METREEVERHEKEPEVTKFLRVISPVEKFLEEHILQKPKKDDQNEKEHQKRASNHWRNEISNDRLSTDGLMHAKGTKTDTSAPRVAIN